MKKNVLSSLGLNEKTAKVYLAGLSLGTTSVQELAHKTGLKRPTVYLHIDELIRQGLFEKIVRNKKHYYRAADSRVLEERLKQNISDMQSALPEFSALRSQTLGRPGVVVYEGEEGMRTVYREVKTANSLRVWSNMGPLLGSFHDVYMELAETLRERRINTKEIIADTKEAHRYSRLVAKVSGPSYSARTATSEGLESDTFLYGNVIALFHLSEHNMFVVRIEDKTIADSMKALFDMAWKSAKAFR